MKCNFDPFGLAAKDILVSKASGPASQSAVSPVKADILKVLFSAYAR